MPTALPSLTKKRRTINGFCLDYYSNQRQDAPVIIMVHGIGVAGNYFFPLANELIDDFNVVVLDLPGSGETIKPKQALTIRQLADTIAAFITRDYNTKPILVGHSMGCQIISLLDAAAPRLCGPLVFISPTVNKHERTAPKQLLRLLQDTTKEPLNVNLTIMRDYLRYGFRRYLQTQRYMINDCIEARMPSHHQPSRVVRGSNDLISPHDWAKYLSDSLPNGLLHEIPGHAHAVHHTAARDIATLCREAC